VLVPLLSLSFIRSRDLAVAEAAVTREAFRREQQLGRLLLTLPNVSPAERADGAAAAESALARYAVFDGRGPSAAPLRRLAPGEQAQVHREIGELLLAYAVRVASGGSAAREPTRLRELAETY